MHAGCHKALLHMALTDTNPDALVKHIVAPAGARRPSLTTLRKLIDIAIPLTGVVVILGAVLLLRSDLRVQVAVVGLGMLLIEVGVWKIPHQLLGTGRKYVALRNEVDHFLSLVRQLNSAATALRVDDSPKNREALQEVPEAMHQAVDRMVQVAGKTEAELMAEREVPA